MAAVLILQLQPGLLNLTMRRTDVFVHEQLRLTPLSVSADRIAHVAFRCAVLLAKLDAADAPVDRSGSGPVAEVYPAASLHSWGLTYRSYKQKTSTDALGASLLLPRTRPFALRERRRSAGP